MPDPAVEREMREIRAQLDSMETTQRQTVDVGDVSEAETEKMSQELMKKSVVDEDTAEERLIQSCFKNRCQRKDMDILMYEGNLDVEEMLD
jgi:hypothetical protein